MSSQLFTKQSRINRTAEFKNVFNTGKKYSTRYFAFYFKDNNSSFSRVGIVVTKKVIDSAVKRNQFKRIIRESFRLNKSALMLIDVVVVVYQRAAILDKKQLREELDKEWLKLASFCKKS